MDLPTHESLFAAAMKSLRHIADPAERAAAKQRLLKLADVVRGVLGAQKPAKRKFVKGKKEKKS